MDIFPGQNLDTIRGGLAAMLDNQALASGLVMEAIFDEDGIEAGVSKTAQAFVTGIVAEMEKGHPDCIASKIQVLCDTAAFLTTSLVMVKGFDPASALTEGALLIDLVRSGIQIDGEGLSDLPFLP